MALEIFWTPRAEMGFGKIITYLKTEFIDKEVRKFVRQSHDFFELLSTHPELLEKRLERKRISIVGRLINTPINI